MGTCFDMDAILERATKHQDTAVCVTPPILFQSPSCDRFGPRRANTSPYRALGQNLFAPWFMSPCAV